MKIIALSGKKRAGKDSIADYLVREINAVRIGFADPLKDSVATQFGFNRLVMDQPENKEAPLLKYPALAKDDFSKNAMKYLVKELKGQYGEIPERCTFFGDSMFGLIGDKTSFPLFWTWRAMLIFRGSSERVMDSNYWVKQAVAKMEQGKTYVISDMRYKSELNALVASGVPCTFIRINRFKDSVSTDSSECDLDDYKFENVIENTGTLEDLYKSIMSILK